MYKKAWCAGKLVVLLNKPIAVLTLLFPSPSSLLKLPMGSRLSNGRRERQKSNMFWLAKQQLCTCITLLTTMTTISSFFLLETALKIQLLKISLTFEKLKYMQRWSLKQREFTFWVRFSLPLPLWLLKLAIILTQLHGGYKKLAWCWRVHVMRIWLF